MFYKGSISKLEIMISKKMQPNYSQILEKKIKKNKVTRILAQEENILFYRSKWDRKFVTLTLS